MIYPIIMPMPLNIPNGNINIEQLGVLEKTALSGIGIAVIGLLLLFFALILLICDKDDDGIVIKTGIITIFSGITIALISFIIKVICLVF